MTSPDSRGPIVVGLGSSAGGIEAVSALLAALPRDFRAPIVISQHMPEGTVQATLQLASRGHDRTIAIATARVRMGPGRIYLVPDGHDLCFDDKDPWVRIMPQPVAANADALPHPNVDVMFTEMARAFGTRACAVVLSGMGDDGLRGAEAIRARGGLVYVQDRSTSAVWGMPARIAERGLADREGSVEQIAAWLGELDRRPWALGA